MNQPLLTLLRLPARLDAKEAALLLGFCVHDIPILVKARLLKPLGDQTANGTTWFSTAELENLAKNRAWLDRATKAVNVHWRGTERPGNVILLPDASAVPDAPLEAA